MPYGVMAVVELGLVVYCVLSIVTTPDAQIRNLPRLVWLALVLFFPIVGGIVYLVAGRPQGPARSLPYKGNAGQVPPEYDRPGRATAFSPDDDAAFLRRLQERAEAQRRAAEQQRRDRGTET